MIDLVRGSSREPIPADLAAELRRAGALVEDSRRERPRWFDGRFLSAGDLVREQQYFLAREAELGRASGSGVAAGLQVGAGDGPGTLVIGAGHGVTPAGELVLLERPLEVDLSDIPRAERLSGSFGLGRIPHPPLRGRSGLFALALRPVEFTANPMGAYPTSITGERTVEDGDVVEGTAVVLVPWVDDGGEGTLEARRAHAARAIFLDSATRGLPTGVLPLAMIALEGNTLAWIDAPMLRRELGADRADLPGLGVAPRALRLAHLLQHQGYLADEVGSRGERTFPAAAVFRALPAAGPLPPGVIDPGDFTQRYFPASVNVEFSIIPEDELPALVEESLALPPIDLEAPEESLASTSVIVLAPVPRNEWRSVVARLESVSRSVRASAPNRVAARRPLEVLMGLRVAGLILPPPDPTTPSDAEWQRLARLNGLWYVRRRQLARGDDVEGTSLRLAGREGEITDGLRQRLERLGLRARLDAVLERATPAARGEIAGLLSSPRLSDSPALTAAALGDLGRAERVDLAAVVRTASAVTAPEAGSGLARLSEGGASENPSALERIASEPEWRAIDRVVRVAPRDELAGIGERIAAGRPLAELRVSGAGRRPTR